MRRERERDVVRVAHAERQPDQRGDEREVGRAGRGRRPRAGRRGACAARARRSCRRSWTRRRRRAMRWRGWWTRCGPPGSDSGSPQASSRGPHRHRPFPRPRMRSTPVYAYTTVKWYTASHGRPTPSARCPHRADRPALPRPRRADAHQAARRAARRRHDRRRAHGARSAPRSRTSPSTSASCTRPASSAAPSAARSRYYAIADDGVFELCEQVCGGLRAQIRELDQILTGGHRMTTTPRSCATRVAALAARARAVRDGRHGDAAERRCSPPSSRRGSCC